jgi:hypothetical protein
VTPSRKTAQSQGRDGLPVAWQWLSDLGVKPGEFQVETKARLRHAMKSREWPEKQRVWACLSLATMGFNQELAVKLERGQVVPLTQGDIEKQTGILVKNVHRCVLDLEGEGWLLRKAVDEERGLRRGEVQIHCYAVPRPPKRTKMEPEAQPEADRYADVAPEIAYWSRHLKLGVPTAENMERAREIAVSLNTGVESYRELCRPEPDQMLLPGVPVNPVKASKRVAGLSELKPRAVETPLARGGQKSAEGLRAVRSDPRARALPNKEEIKEIKNTEEGGSVGRSPVLPSTLTDRPTSILISAISKAIQETGICAKLNDTPSSKLLERIAKKLRGGSLEDLKNRVRLRFDGITGLGMLEGLAEDVASSSSAPRAPKKETRSEMNARIDREIAEEERNGVD